MKPTLFLKVILITFAFVVSSTSVAHTEYEEIQVKTSFQVNQQKQLSSVSMVWQYDTFSCQDMLSHEKDVTRLGKILVSRLSRFNFYTSINIGDRRLVTNKINNYKLIKIKDAHGNPSLQLTVNLQVKKPVDINSIKKIKINHADPTRKALLFYDNKQDLVFEKELKSRCKATVEEKVDFDSEVPF